MSAPEWKDQVQVWEVCIWSLPSWNQPWVCTHTEAHSLKPTHTHIKPHTECFTLSYIFYSLALSRLHPHVTVSVAVIMLLLWGESKQRGICSRTRTVTEILLFHSWGEKVTFCLLRPCLHPALTSRSSSYGVSLDPNCKWQCVCMCVCVRGRDSKGGYPSTYREREIGTEGHPWTDRQKIAFSSYIRWGEICLQFC